MKERPLGRKFFVKERPLGRNFFVKERPLGRSKRGLKISCKNNQMGFWLGMELASCRSSIFTVGSPLTFQLWPVLATLGAVPLNGPGGHHYHHDPQLPHHLPSVGECPGQRTLHRDECVLLLVTVHIVGIDVVRLLVVIIPG